MSHNFISFKFHRKNWQFISNFCLSSASLCVVHYNWKVKKTRNFVCYDFIYYIIYISMKTYFITVFYATIRHYICKML